ncbi:carbon-phosphorus lyase complex subunit PhnI, partial [Actinotalea sp. C106]|uniref:carbon-phosphorus lyase complex subunit PhnI n=1 Tax=Actinotalea sp. C106 TaxID=2908644 RepID=UPI0020280F1F
ADEAPGAAEQPALTEPGDGRGDAPSRAATGRVRDLLRGVPVIATEATADGADPARSVLVAPFSRETRLGVLARAETASLVSLASLVLAERREAVLVEGTTSVADLRVPHPRTGVACRVAEVPVAEAEAVVDAEVDGLPGFAVGWGGSLGANERRVIALALLDGALQGGDEAAARLTLDTQTVLAATDGAATNGFVEHLRLPHYASFASYLAQARPVPEEPTR